MKKKEELLKFVKAALKEDIGSADITTTAIFGKTKQGACAHVVAKEDLVLSGSVPFFLVWKILGVKVKNNFKDGTRVSTGKTIYTLCGDIKNILKGERTALNFLGHLSGIATLTNQFVQKIKGTKAKILDTRKTLPCFRALEKQAVKHGGGFNHRFGLYDQILIKENHIKRCKNISDALKRVKNSKYSNYITVVEVENLSQLKSTLKYKVDRTMLDNMPPALIKKAVKIIAGQTKTEVSGNVSLKNIKKIAALGVDYISVGAITHSAKSSDISLLID